MQRTTNYGLCQYEGSDKTSYLVNYNDDMLKIDTAIKNASDGGAGAQTTADRAESKADTNTGSINTLNTQINGAGGIASDLSTVVGNVQTINSLIGNGTPTTADQTIIGAINSLESAIAPREDANTLANSYAIGEQFARGGSVYSALTPLVAGTAFASLTLNTDYKVSDTLTKQIAKINNGYAFVERKEVSATGDGVKTRAELIAEITSALATIVNNLPTNERIKISDYHYVNDEIPLRPRFLSTGVTVADTFTFSAVVAGVGYLIRYGITSGNSANVVVLEDRAGTITDLAQEVVSDGSTLVMYYDLYRAIL